MNFVIDTNVLISALLKKDTLPYQVVRMALNDSNHLFYTREILEEYQYVLSKDKFHFSKIQQNDAIELIRQLGILKYSKSDVIKKEFNDKTDQKFYDLAKAEKCFLITGNEKHFPKDCFVLTPREFFDILYKLA